MTSNKHGLARSIPKAVKLDVRQKCGFGCIVCAASIYDYDHFRPSFAEAKAHEAEGIILLCPTHHAEKGRGVLPGEFLEEFIKEPMALRNGQTSVVRPYFTGVPSLRLGGGGLIYDTPIPVAVNDDPLIAFLPPEEGSSVTRINARISSEDGSNLLRIEENEWIVETGVWDYEWVGHRMTIKDYTGQTSLQLGVYPPTLIEVQRLRFNGSGKDVIITETEITVGKNILVDCVVSGCVIGLAIGGGTIPAGFRIG